ncbi:MAG: hypothetical protein WKF85_07830 [Chitinophagaceae bacterium]
MQKRIQILILLLSIFFTPFSQDNKKIFYLIIPETLEEGKIDIFKSDMYFKDATNYIFTFFRTSPHSYQGAGILINVENKVEEISKKLNKKKY